MTDLLPCPLCGDEAIFVSTRPDPDGRREWRVVCDGDCGLYAFMPEWHETKEQVAAAWNKRTAPTVRLQARKPDGGDWINIFPAQLGWMAKEGYDVRALESDLMLLRPSVEMDDSVPLLDIVWRVADSSFSITLSPSKLVGVYCAMDPPRSAVAWTVDLPAGLVTIDHTSSITRPPLNSEAK